MEPEQSAHGLFEFSKGYLAGGFNQSTDDKDSAKFDAQTTVNQEIGAKTAWLNNRLFLNANLYYVDIKDMHVWGYENGAWIASNAAKAHSQGFEIEAKARPTHGLDISASLSQIESKFDDYGDYTDNKTLQTPEYTYSLAAQYRDPSGVFVRGATKDMAKPITMKEIRLSGIHISSIHFKVGYEASNWEEPIYMLTNLPG